tara:strand:+ start:420 stop:743 length:324 start_codon:yes stop_codon:yes gene_type:complete
MRDHREIIIRPLLTEKMSFLEETQRKYAFQVSLDSNKIEIKNAIQNKFDVKIEKVATMRRKGKQKRTTVRSGGRVIRTEGHTSNWKRAIVTLKEGFSIDLLQGETTG